MTHDGANGIPTAVLHMANVAEPVDRDLRAR